MNDEEFRLKPGELTSLAGINLVKHIDQNKVIEILMELEVIFARLNGYVHSKNHNMALNTVINAQQYIKVMRDKLLNEKKLLVEDK